MATHNASTDLKIWYLKRINLLKGMDPKEMMAFSKMVAMKSYKKHEPIYLPGEPGEYLYLLKKGCVKLSRLSPDGQEFTIAYIKAGEVFGELESIEGVEREHFASAHRDTLVCLLTRSDLVRLLEMKPDLSLKLTKLMGFRRRRFEMRIANLTFRSAPQKLAFLFESLVEEFGEVVLEGIKINLPLTHQDIANLIGATRQTVSELVSEFRKSGFVSIHQKYITVKDLPAIKDFVQ
jgi:CRP/FNR family transcriptional regulator, cyclic AMP receptor protein